jgi:hypothetical protein
MDITNLLKYNNLTISILEALSKTSISGWSIDKINYKTEKIIKKELIKTREYYILNGIKFHIDSTLLIKDSEENIIEIKIYNLYEKFLNKEFVEILDYNLNKIQIIEFEYIEKSAFKDTTSFVKFKLSQHQLFVPYSESAILIRGMLSF